jgi:hypothetical protein
MHTFLNRIIKEMNYVSYLEIGVDDPRNNFNHIHVKKKVGVDPYFDNTGCHAWNERNKENLISLIDEKAVFHQMTSNDYFDMLRSKRGKRSMFDLIYIDGLHIESQVDKDIENALQFVSEKGIIVLDDVPPANAFEEKTPPEFGQPWRGTVWRSFAKLRLQENSLGLNDHGLYTITSIFKSIILPYRQCTPAYKNAQFPHIKLSFQFLKTFENNLLNNILEEQFFNIITQKDA